MQKNKLSLESLSVESFDATPVESMLEFSPTRGANTACASAVDACPTRLCETNLC